MNFRIVALGLCGSLFGACTVGVTDTNPSATDPVGGEDQEIVRGHTEKHFPQVVAVRINGFNGGWTLCSGTYFSSRMVVTAAHCLRSDAIPGQSYVYFGDDFNGDVTSLPDIPDPGHSSKWARIETIQAHPDYDASVNYPDIAVAFLDRELPFAPIPLDRHHLQNWQKEGKIVGWGGSLALTPDITQVEGAGIKRSANVKILGSPTDADFHADDPNPGILDPAIQPNLLKTDGRAPRPNTCAGDSGGPLLVHHDGRDELVGVGFWTGLSCEDYAIFTRIDPFLGYFDGEKQLAGGKPVTPRVECVEDAGSGHLIAHFGYENDNALTVNIPYGFDNSLSKDTAHARPTAFGPGDNPYAFSVPFNSGDKAKWTLDSKGTPAITVKADATSPVCPANDINVACGNSCAAEFGAACAQDGLSRGQCVRDCVSTQQIIDTYYGCGDPYTTYVQCIGGLSSDAANWDCSFQGFPASPSGGACADELNNLYTCFYYGPT